VPTNQDELRNAMNDVVRTTEPLSAATVLHAGQRYRTRRRLLAGTGAAAAVLAVVVGIGVLNLGKAPESTAGSSDAAAQLRQSVEALQDGNYTFTRTGADLVRDIAKGAVHLPDGSLFEYAGGMSIMRAQGAAYLLYGGPGKAQMAQLKKVALPTLPRAQRQKWEEAFAALLDGGWVRTDEKRLAAASAVQDQSSLDYVGRFPSAKQPDVTGADALVNAVRTADRSGNVITGTLDGTEVDGSLGLLGPIAAGFYGPDAKAMSYRAVLDGQGRLIELTVTPATLASAPPTPTEPQPPLVIKISQYDQSAAPTAPSTTTTLTDTAYDLLARDVD
jgi:roadblock/LC7 domain-containing protein